MLHNDINIQEYKDALFYALNKLFRVYEQRITDNPTREHKHVTSEDVGKYAGMGALVGTAVGTVAPGLGNAIGAAAGTLTGVAVAGAAEVQNYRKNKKIDNAGKVDDVLGQNDRDVLREIANRVIDERESIIRKLGNTSKNKERVANYLAANIMAAIKHDGGHTVSPVADIISAGLRNPRSRKERSRTLQNADGTSIKSSAIARYQFFKSPALSASPVAFKGPALSESKQHSISQLSELTAERDALVDMMQKGRGGHHSILDKRLDFLNEVIKLIEDNQKPAPKKP